MTHFGRLRFARIVRVAAGVCATRVGRGHLARRRARFTRCENERLRLEQLERQRRRLECARLFCQRVARGFAARRDVRRRRTCRARKRSVRRKTGVSSFCSRRERADFFSLVLEHKTLCRRRSSLSGEEKPLHRCWRGAWRRSRATRRRARPKPPRSGTRTAACSGARTFRRRGY